MHNVRLFKILTKKCREKIGKEQELIEQDFRTKGCEHKNIKT